MSRHRRPQWAAPRGTQPQRPVNPQAVAALQAAYETLHGAGRSHRWTREETVTLGRLYVQAWGRVPNPWHMQNAYGLPQPGVIRRIWGSYAAYYAALAVP